MIAAVRQRHPGFLFMAEVYWDLEWEMQQQGFDYAYDKRLYDRLLGVLRHRAVREGQWQLLERVPACEGNGSSDRFIAYSWLSDAGEFLLAVVNYAPHASQCHVRLPFPELGGLQWVLQDLLGDARYTRDGADLVTRGLYLDVAPWQCHVFAMTKVT
jgi:hypothetical protein